MFDDELRDMRLELVNEVIKVLGDIGPDRSGGVVDNHGESPCTGGASAGSTPANCVHPASSIEDDVGQRLAALRFEVNACEYVKVNNLDDAAELLAGLREEYKALASVIRSWEQVVGEHMDAKKQTVQGVGQLERHRDVSRRNWGHEDLLRVVLDSDRRSRGREGDGEVESDLDVLRDVYGLRGYNARVTALRARGIDPDEYSEHEDRGWKVSIK